MISGGLHQGPGCQPNPSAPAGVGGSFSNCPLNGHCSDICGREIRKTISKSPKQLVFHRTSTDRSRLTGRGLHRGWMVTAGGSSPAAVLSQHRAGCWWLPRAPPLPSWPTTTHLSCLHAAGDGRSSAGPAVPHTGPCWAPSWLEGLSRHHRPPHRALLGCASAPHSTWDGGTPLWGLSARLGQGDPFTSLNTGSGGKWAPTDGPSASLAPKKDKRPQPLLEGDKIAADYLSFYP